MGNVFEMEKRDSAELEAPSSNMMETQNQREVAEIQSALVIAKRFPRDQVKAMDRILQACARPTLAEGAMYQYARGGTNISGASIRLAEAIAQNWGNMQYGIRELEQVNGESIVEAFAWDTETNVKQTKVFKVKHTRHTKRGSYRLEDPRDIYEMVANQGARRLRACILGVVPSDVVDSAVKACEDTLTSKVEITPAKIKSMVDAFKVYGVTKEMLEARIQRRLDSITPALMVNLGKIYNSLKDGMSTASEWFDIPKEPTKKTVSKKGKDALKEKLEGDTKQGDLL